MFNEERRYPYSYTYRDYVIQSFNDDLPYDQFLLQQIAADRLPPQNGNTQSLAALGFLTVGRRFLNNQQDIIDDRIDVVTRGLLGLDRGLRLAAMTTSSTRFQPPTITHSTASSPARTSLRILL